MLKSARAHKTAHAMCAGVLAETQRAAGLERPDGVDGLGTASRLEILREEVIERRRVDTSGREQQRQVPPMDATHGELPFQTMLARHRGGMQYA